MRALPIAAALLAATSSARAEDRLTTVTVGGVFGMHSLPEDAGGGGGGIEPAIARVADEYGGPRLTLAFERAHLAYPAERGYRTDAQLVPELVAGAFLEQDRAEGMLGVGLRGELRVAQREMGLWRLTARVTLYVAARGFVVGEARDPYGELVIGEYFPFGRTGRIGFEFGAMARDRDGAGEREKGLVTQVYVGGAL